MIVWRERASGFFSSWKPKGKSENRSAQNCGMCFIRCVAREKPMIRRSRNVGGFSCVELIISQRENGEVLFPVGTRDETDENY